MRSAAMAALAVVVLYAPPAVANNPLSETDKLIYRQAFQKAEQGRWSWVERMTRKAKDRLPAKILTWLNMTQQGNSYPFEVIRKFIEDNPDWPDLDEIRRRAEEAINASTPPDDVLAWFAGKPPLTTDGMVAMCAALTAKGDTEKARAMVRRTWIEGDFGRQPEKNFYRRYHKMLSRDDHMARLDRLLWEGRHRPARRMMRHVDQEYHPVAIARIRLRENRGGVDWAIRRIPDKYLSDAGFQYERLRWRLRKGHDDGALEILRTAPADMVYPELWWRERSVMARRLLAKGLVNDAYKVASAHGLKNGSSFAEAEWLAGWIALRFQHNYRQALGHFERLHRAMNYPISQARAAYWAGRAADAMGNKAAADRWFRQAAKFDATYYGQLAAIQHNPGTLPRVPPEPHPHGADIAAFNRLEMVKAVLMLDQIGRDELLKPFLLRQAEISQNAAHKVLAGRLALALGRPDLGVRIGRQSYQAGMQLTALAYPVIDMPDGEPERALLLSVARQESNFAPNAKSHAGARGLMQLMPATARAVSRSIKTRFSRSRLISDPDYNIHLGRAYLAGLIDQYGGSYVLAIAGYNAGPGSVKRWIRTLGDPRFDDVDIIDWIERIPYSETRNYVQRVLENLQIYRRRINSSRIAWSLEHDLRR